MKVAKVTRSYIKWRELEINPNQGSDIQSELDDKLLARTMHWKVVLQHLLSVTLFLAERGFPFGEESSKIEDRYKRIF